MKFAGYLISPAILIIVLLAFGCKKNSPIKIDKYSNVLTRVAIIKTMDLKMYTNQTEIIDTSIKNNYIRKYSQYFNLDKIPHESSYTVTIVAPDTVRFSGSGFYSFKKTGDQFIFTSRDVFQWSVDDSLFINMFKYNAPYTPFSPFPNSPNHILYHTHDIRTGYGDTTKLSLPIVSFRLTRGFSPHYSYSSFAGLRNDDFNPAIIQSLGPRDTLAIQLFNYELKAQLLNP